MSTNSLTQFNATHWLKQWGKSETWLAFLFIFPSLIGFLVFFAIPSVRGFMISFTDWDLINTAKSVGVANYVRLWDDSEFWHALRVTGLYVVLNIPVQTVLAIGLAVLMDRVIKSSFLRSLFVLPWLLPNVVVALLWLWMLDPQLGLVNQFLGLFGIDRQPFLGSPTQAMPAIASINIWRHVGYTALLIFAGLQTIPKDIYEAASIDGSTELHSFWTMTLPLLRPVLVFVLVTTVIGSFQVFDTIAITTKGGPVDATRVIYWYIYDYAFARFKMGIATAISVVLFAILMCVTIIQLRYFRADSSDLAE